MFTCACSHGKFLSALLLLLAALPVHADPASPRLTADAAPVRTPDKGMLLVAGRDMLDPRFQHSVVLLVRHAEDGTVGLIINRPTTVLLSQAVSDLKGVDRVPHTLFFGGPVQLNVMMFLARSQAPIEDADQVKGDVYVSGSKTMLERMLGNRKPDTELRVYAGYAGWAPGQLAAEIAHGDWHLVPADSRTIFEKEPTKIWQELIDRESPDGLMVRHGSDAYTG